MTTLKFPEVVDFINYLKEKDIHRYGIVSICETTRGSEGVGIYSESFRLSSIDDTKKEVLQCDARYYRGISVTEEHNRKEANEPKEKMLKWLHEKITKWLGDYEMQMLHCQFSK